jgi:hypothetical protein
MSQPLQNIGEPTKRLRSSRSILGGADARSENDGSCGLCDWGISSGRKSYAMGTLELIKLTFNRQKFNLIKG